MIKALLGSIFPYGIAWDYSGTLNPEIIPIFQSICHFEGSGIPSGAGNGTQLEPIWPG